MNRLERLTRLAMLRVLTGGRPKYWPSVPCGCRICRNIRARIFAGLIPSSSVSSVRPPRKEPSRV